MISKFTSESEYIEADTGEVLERIKYIQHKKEFKIIEKKTETIKNGENTYHIKNRYIIKRIRNEQTRLF